MFAQVYQGEAVFNELEAEWDVLAKEAMTNTPFQMLPYQSSWWRNLQPPDSELLTIAVRDGDQQLLAIACLYLAADKTLRFNGCVEETDYLDLICRAQDAHSCWELVVATFFGDDFPEWQRIELCNIPQNSPTRTILPKVAAQHGMTVIESVNEVCPVVTLPSTFEAYLAVLDSKQRREINRKLRRAAGAGAMLYMVNESDNLADCVDQFLDLLQKSTFEKRDWLNDGRRALFHEVAAAAQKAGILQLLFLEIDAQKAAALFNFDYDGRIWVYNSGLDPEMFSALSPGVVITAKAIELAIESGHEEFDFLRGDEEYKYRFGAEDTTVYRLQLAR